MNVQTPFSNNGICRSLCKAPLLPYKHKKTRPKGGGGEKLEALCATTISWQQRKVTLFKAEHQEKGSCGKPGLQWNMHPANNDDQQTTRQLWCSHSNYPTESPSFRQF